MSCRMSNKFNRRNIMRQMFFLFTLLLLVSCSDSTSSGDKEDNIIKGSVTDIDGNVYETVQIGDQVWMAENLKVTHYRNGDPIPNVTDDTEWKGLSTGAYCTFENSSTNSESLGLLYNWYAIGDTINNKIAPEGWHVPTDEEWKELEMYLGMSRKAADDTDWRGTTEGLKLKATSGWYNNGNGTNEVGFTALPGSFRSYNNGVFGSPDSTGYWWSVTEYSSSKVWGRMLSYFAPTIFRYKSAYDKNSGFSVRCVKD